MSPVQTIARNLNIELDSGFPIKCGMPLIAFARERWNELSPQARFEISSVLVRPFLQKSRPTPSGKLRIHYDTSATGVNTPALLDSLGQRIPNSFEKYVDSVAMIFDYCWQYEVDSLGYLPPPADSVSGAAALGGDSKYDVYIMNFNDGTFGYTQPFNGEIMLSSAPNEKSTSHIVIENDFRGYRTSGMNGLKVTAAHEFHHSIQIGRYGIWSTKDFYFNELASSWMEDVVFTSINDYYFDVARYFQNYRDGLNRSLPFTNFDPSFSGYERSIWAHFLSKRFGRNVMRAIWEQEQSQPLFQGMRSALESYGTTLEAEYTSFAYWNFFTADRADTARFYPEGKSYPRLVRNAAATFSGSTAVMANGAFPFSAQMYEVVYGSDTVNAFVVNTDADAVLRGDNAVRNLEVRVSLTGA
ncbi:MAG: MXAN_6640 family putative metalloprotease, partial [Bacteroidota bacterium]